MGSMACPLCCHSNFCCRKDLYNHVRAISRRLLDMKCYQCKKSFTLPEYLSHLEIECCQGKALNGNEIVTYIKKNNTTSKTCNQVSFSAHPMLVEDHVHGKNDLTEIENNISRTPDNSTNNKSLTITTDVLQINQSAVDEIYENGITKLDNFEDVQEYEIDSSDEVDNCESNYVKEETELHMDIIEVTKDSDKKYVHDRGDCAVEVVESVKGTNNIYSHEEHDHKNAIIIEIANPGRNIFDCSNSVPDQGITDNLFVSTNDIHLKNEKTALSPCDQNILIDSPSKENITVSRLNAKTVKLGSCKLITSSIIFPKTLKKHFHIVRNPESQNCLKNSEKPLVPKLSQLHELPEISLSPSTSPVKPSDLPLSVAPLGLSEQSLPLKDLSTQPAKKLKLTVSCPQPRQKRDKHINIKEMKQFKSRNNLQMLIDELVSQEMFPQKESISFADSTPSLASHLSSNNKNDLISKTEINSSAIASRIQDSSTSNSLKHSCVRYKSDLNFKNELLKHECQYICNICHVVRKNDFALHMHKEMHKREKAEEYINKPCEETYVCKECGKILRTNLKLTHQYVHRGLKVFECSVCPHVYFTMKSLVIHMEIHKNLRPFQCSICSKFFRTVSLLRVHKKSHLTVRRFKCSFCEKTFNQKAEVTLHERCHTGEKPILCNICGKSFRTPTLLKIHMRVHTNERPYECKLCHKQYKQYSVLKNHMEIHEDRKEYSCPRCPHTCNTIVLLHGHLKTHEKPFECEYCKRSFSKRSEMIMHIKEIHQVLDEERDKFSCIICGAMYGRGYSLEVHLRTHGNIGKMNDPDLVKQLVEKGSSLATNPRPRTPKPKRPSRKKILTQKKGANKW